MPLRISARRHPPDSRPRLARRRLPHVGQAPVHVGTDWDRQRMHARVRETARNFPKGRVPQGFMCCPVLLVGERSLPAASKCGELEAVSRIKWPTIGARAVSGPYLFFGVVALTARRRATSACGAGRSRSCRSIALCRWIRTSSARPSGCSRRRCGCWTANRLCAGKFTRFAAVAHACLPMNRTAQLWP